jgi:hypothetical protein
VAIEAKVAVKGLGKSADVSESFACADMAGAFGMMKAFLGHLSQQVDAAAAAGKAPPGKSHPKVVTTAEVTDGGRTLYKLEATACDCDDAHAQQSLAALQGVGAQFAGQKAP